MADTVFSGLFWGFTQSELDEQKDQYKRAVKQQSDMTEAAGGGRVAGGTFGGQTVTFSFPSGINSLEQWRQEIVSAQAQLDDETPTSGNSAAVRFV